MNKGMTAHHDERIVNALAIIIEAQKDQLSLTKALINKINRMDHTSVKQTSLQEIESRMKCCETSLIDLVSLTSLMAIQSDCSDCSLQSVYLPASKCMKH